MGKRRKTRENREKHRKTRETEENEEKHGETGETQKNTRKQGESGENTAQSLTVSCDVTERYSPRTPNIARSNMAALSSADCNFTQSLLKIRHLNWKSFYVHATAKNKVSVSLQRIRETNFWAEKHKVFWHQSEARTAGLVRHCPQGLFSPFFTFLRAIFSRPFRLSLAPTICPWVSEDDTTM